MSRNDVIRTFQISAATLGRYLRQHRETGDLTPRRHRGGAPEQVGSEQHPTLRELLAASPDATLAELCQQWHYRTGVLVSQATMSRALATIETVNSQREKIGLERLYARTKFSFELKVPASIVALARTNMN
jgi:transposase